MDNNQNNQPYANNNIQPQQTNQPQHPQGQPIYNQINQTPQYQQFNGGVVNPQPNTKKPKKPLYKKWWFWLIVVFILLGIIGSVGGNDEDSSSTTTSVQGEVTEEVTEDGTTEPSTTELTTKKESKKEYKNSCESISYKELARNPDKYIGTRVKFTGEVLQVIESTWGSSVEYRISVSKEDWGYSADDVIYVTYTPQEGESRILEDDIVTFYGEYQGLMSYNSTLGGKITIPEVSAEYIDLKE